MRKKRSINYGEHLQLPFGTERRTIARYVVIKCTACVYVLMCVMVRRSPVYAIEYMKQTRLVHRYICMYATRDRAAISLGMQNTTARYVARAHDKTIAKLCAFFLIVHICINTENT